MAGLGLLILRLMLAAIFAAHGAHELFGVGAGPGIGPGGLSNTASLYASSGLHPEYVLALAAGLIHLAGAFLLIIGMLTRWAVIALIADVAIGAWKVHLPWGFFMNWSGTAGQGHGLEYSLLLIAGLLCLLFTGAGDWSFDGRRANSAAARAAGRARLRGNM
jgi:putative oxidoreductase